MIEFHLTGFIWHYKQTIANIVHYAQVTSHIESNQRPTTQCGWHAIRFPGGGGWGVMAQPIKSLLESPTA